MTDMNGKRILIVDDDRFMRMTIRSIVTSIGRFAVDEAADGMQGLEKLVAFRPDLVLCDVGMKPMDGIAFVEALRSSADESQCGLPVIMLTSDATESTILTAGRLQISGYLLKPVASKRVASLFRSIFDGRDAAARAS